MRAALSQREHFLVFFMQVSLWNASEYIASERVEYFREVIEGRKSNWEYTLAWLIL